MAAASKATTISSQYALLSKITDPHLRHVLKLILDQTSNLNNQAPNIGQVTQPLADHLDVNNNRVQNVADPVDKQDVVTKAYLEKQVGHILATFAAPKV